MEQLFPWPELTHITSRGQAIPKQGLSPRKPLRMGWLGAQGEGTRAPQALCLSPASSRHCWTERSVIPFHSLGWAASSAGGHWQHQHLFPHEEAQCMDELNSSSMNREHGWETFKPSSRWAFRPSHARWARATLMSMTRTTTGLGWLLPWTLTDWG